MKESRKTLTGDADSGRKAVIDGLLLALPGVVAKKIIDLDAYFVNDRMFACLSGAGIGLRLPVALATELQFSRDGVSAFTPGGVASTREWVQLSRQDPEHYAQDLDLFKTSLEFVRAARSR